MANVWNDYDSWRCGKFHVNVSGTAPDDLRLDISIDGKAGVSATMEQAEQLGELNSDFASLVAAIADHYSKPGVQPIFAPIGSPY
jgi:hypothetical protein